MSVKPGSNEYKCRRLIQTIPTGLVLLVFGVEKT